MTALHCQSLGGQVVYSIILNKLFLKPTSQITWKKQVLLLVFTDKTSSNAWKYRHSSDSSASPGLSWGVACTASHCGTCERCKCCWDSCCLPNERKCGSHLGLPIFVAMTAFLSTQTELMARHRWASVTAHREWIQGPTCHVPLAVFMLVQVFPT